MILGPATKDEVLRPVSFARAGASRSNADVLGAHLAQSKGADGLDGLGGSELPADLVDPLVQVDGVLPGDHLLDGGLGFLVLLVLVGHFCAALLLEYAEFSVSST